MNLDSRSPLGRLLRLPLRLVPPTAAVLVLSGPLCGMRWIAGSAPAGTWVGTLERAKLKQFVRRLRRGMTVWDVGAKVGLYTLPSTRAVGPTGRVYVFEPMRRNLELLRRHLAMNRLSNVEIYEVAVADAGGILRMAEGDSPSEFHADPAGHWQVPAVTLDDWLAATGSPSPDLVKVDVEGSDAAVLRGGARTFAAYRPPIYLALHGERQRRECAALLGGWGYRVTSLERGMGPEESSEWLAEPL